MSSKRGAGKRKQGSDGPVDPGLSETTTAYVQPPKRRKMIRFGDYTVPAAILTDEQIAERIAEGQAALRRAASRIVRPGVRIRPRKGVPLYHLDDDDPDVIIRTLDGVVERGIYADGEFKKLP